jgi:probable phosphoglycerate mutase
MSDSVETVARLLLVRHGESQVMVDGVVGGPTTCSGLSHKGRAQAAALRDRFAGGAERPVDVVYSSPLPRARETTDIVLPALGNGGLEVQTHDELEEFRLGEADGLTWEEVRRRYGPLPSVENDPYRVLVPGGDSRAGFRHRVAMALADIAEQHHGQTVFVGCHGGVVSAAMAVAFGLAPNQQAVELPTVVTSVTELEIVRGAGRGRRLVCHRYNDIGHLRGTDLDPNRDAG